MHQATAPECCSDMHQAIAPRSMMPMRGCAKNARCRLITWLAQVLPPEFTSSRTCSAQHRETVVDLAYFTWLLSIWLGETDCGSVEAGAASVVGNGMSCRHNATAAKCLVLGCDQNVSRKLFDIHPTAGEALLVGGILCTRPGVTMRHNGVSRA